MQNELYSPISNTLVFDLNAPFPSSPSEIPLLAHKGTSNKLGVEYEMVGKLGEGSFGEAFMVRSRRDGSLFAVKKAKEKYTGYRDRE
jgi:hypothetical protein